MPAAQVVIAARSFVYLGNVGTVAPADATVALAAGWVSVGDTTPDSLSFSTSPEFEEVPSAQSDYPIRRFQTSDAAAIEIDLLNWSATNFKSVYGGGAVTPLPLVTGQPQQYKFVPPRLGDRTEKACIVEVIDGAKNYRFIFPRVLQTEGVANQLQKGSTATLPLRLQVLGADGVDAFYLLTNDSAFA